MAGRSAGTLVTSRACLRAAAAVRTVREPARGDGTGGACGILRGPGGGKCSSMLGFYERCGHRQWASLPPIGGEPHAQTFHIIFLVLHVVPSHAPPPLSLPPYPLRILPSAMGRKHRPRPSSAHKSARRAENVATDQRGECRGKGAAQVVSKKKKNATPGRARSAARTTAHRRWNEG